MQVADNVVRRFNLRQMDEFLVTNIPVSYVESLPNRAWQVQRMCRDKLCCEFSMAYQRLADNGAVEDSSRYFYKLTSSSGREKLIDEQSKELYCAVVACTTDKASSCGKRFQPGDGVEPSLKFKEITINMIVELETNQNDYLVMPTSVDFSMLPLDTSKVNFARSSIFEING